MSAAFLLRNQLVASRKAKGTRDKFIINQGKVYNIIFQYAPFAGVSNAFHKEIGNGKRI